MDWRAFLVSTAVFLHLGATIDPVKILAFFPFPFRSHHNVFRPIIEALAWNGHQVTYVTGFPYTKVPENITQINILSAYNNLIKDGRLEDQVAYGELSIIGAVVSLYMVGYEYSECALQHPQLQRLIHSTNETFHAVLLESYFAQEYASAFLHKFGAVGIEVGPVGDCGWVNEMSALPDNVAYQIDYKNENNNDLDFFERLYNTYIKIVLTLGGYFYLWFAQSFVDKHFNYTGWERRPPLSELVANRSIILTNSHFAVGYSVPLAPHRKEIGGINVRPNKGLPQELQESLDSAEQGVIYMSLGSNVNTSDITSEKLREFLVSEFIKLPYLVLLKWDTVFSNEIPANIIMSTWFPQQEILAHKNIKLFITHGGFLSIVEAVHHGVPMVGIPFFGDQAKNLIQVQTAGYGVLLRYRNLSSISIRWAINEVISNPRYKAEAVRRSAIFRDRRVSPAEEAAYWVEYAIKYPNALTPKGAYLPFFVLHNWDVYLFMILTGLATKELLQRLMRYLRQSCSVCFVYLSNSKQYEVVKVWLGERNGKNRNEMGDHDGTNGRRETTNDKTKRD